METTKVTFTQQHKYKQIKDHEPRLGQMSMFTIKQPKQLNYATNRNIHKFAEYQPYTVE